MRNTCTKCLQVCANFYEEVSTCRSEDTNLDSNRNSTNTYGDVTRMGDNYTLW